MTSYEIDLQHLTVTTAEATLNNLCFETAMLLETQPELESAYCQIFIPVTKKVTVFAEVQMMADRKPIYFVTSSRNQAAEIFSLTYREALSKLETLLAA